MSDDAPLLLEPSNSWAGPSSSRAEALRFPAGLACGLGAELLSFTGAKGLTLKKTASCFDDGLT